MVGPKGVAQSGRRISGLGVRRKTGACNDQHVGHRVDIHRERRAAVFAAVAMDLGRAAEGLKVAALGPAKAGAGENRESDESRSLQPSANRAMAVMHLHCGLRHLELIRSTKARSFDLLEICHDLSSLLDASHRSWVGWVKGFSITRLWDARNFFYALARVVRGKAVE